MKKYKNYEWNTQKELAEKLGKANSTISGWLRKNEGKTIYDYIDMVEASTNHSDSYKNITWESHSDLSRKLGKSNGYVNKWLKDNPGKTVYDCIEYTQSEKVMAPSENWMLHYEQIRIYYKEHGTLIIPIRFEQNGLKIGRWLSHQREYFWNNNLPKVKQDLLNELTPDWMQANAKHENQGDIRIGEEYVSIQGQKYKIIGYRDSRTVTIEFEDGTILENRAYKNVKNGSVKNPNYMRSKIGEVHKMKNGQSATVISYDGNGKVSVRFEDGTIRGNVDYSFVKQGKISNPNYTRIMQSKGKYIGQEFVLNNGFKVKIIDYNGKNNITIEFEDGTIKPGCRYECLEKGTVAHPNPDAVAKRKGETHTASNGLRFTIKEYLGCANATIEFEDGEIVNNVRYDRIMAGSIKHPYLSKRGRSEYKNFITDGVAFEEKGKVYYNCMCKVCKTEDILTPQDMIKHSKNCKGD